jgi:hypothetical protein
MNGELLMLFVILCLALLLSSFLGVRFREGMDNADATPANAAPANAVASPLIDNVTPSSQTDTQSGPSLYGVETNVRTGGNTKTISGTGPMIGTTSVSDKMPAVSTRMDYDNYNHYSRSAEPVLYYGPGGSTARIIDIGNFTRLVINSKNGKTDVYYINNAAADPRAKIFFGPDGSSAKITMDNTGKNIVEIIGKDGEKTTFHSDNIYTSVSVDDSLNEANNSVSNYQTKYDEAFSSNIMMSQNPNQLPPGIPRNQIPAGEEDLYILKSQVIFPNCPACPNPIVKCPKKDEVDDTSKCPPCPPCARCPEPSYECKKVPTYKAFNPDTMPIPVLNSFSTFGM